MLKDWNGSDGGFRNGGNWSPGGAPAAGDELTITDGIARLRGGSFGSADSQTTINLAGNADQPATLLVANATLTNVTIDETASDPSDNATKAGTLIVKGHVVNDGGAFIAGGNLAATQVLDIELQPHAKLINDGTIMADPGTTLNIDGCDARLENDGTISATGGDITIASRLTGTGDVVSSEGRQLSGRVELEIVGRRRTDGPSRPRGGAGRRAAELPGFARCAG